MAEFTINNKIHLATKVFPFMANYRRELWMRADIRKKEKVEKATEFVEKSIEKSRSSIEEKYEETSRQKKKESEE